MLRTLALRREKDPAAIVLTDWGSPKPVSYTHLDVYKRQDVLAAGYLAGYLERPAIFDRVGFTERPDTLCGKLHEGRIGLRCV